MFFATARAGTVCVGGGGADELVIVLAYQVTITELKTVIKSMLMKSILLWPCLLSQKIRSRTITRKRYPFQKGPDEFKFLPHFSWPCLPPSPETSIRTVPEVEE